VAAVAARGLPRRTRLAVLVPCLCARDRRQRAHARAGRGAVRASDLKRVLQAENVSARGVRHRFDRARRGAVDFDAIVVLAAADTDMTYRTRPRRPEVPARASRGPRRMAATSLPVAHPSRAAHSPSKTGVN